MVASTTPFKFLLASVNGFSLDHEYVHLVLWELTRQHQIHIAEESGSSIFRLLLLHFI